MYMKKCPECEKKSYSASKQGKWFCPHCKQDLTKVEAKLPDNNNTQKEEE